MLLLRVKSERKPSVLELRAYQATDFKRVIQIWWEAWHSSSGYAHHRPVADWEQRWHGLEKSHKIVVVERQERVVAFAALNVQACILSQIFVSPVWQRQGIGRQLMRWASLQCPNGFKLKTAADNQTSRAFYKTFGMVETGHSINDFNDRKEIEYSM